MAKKVIKHHAIVAEFGKRLRQARANSGMSQQQLASRSHLSTNYIGKVERGEAAIGLDVLAQLAAALQVDPANLVSDGEHAVHPLDLVRDELLQKVKKLLSRNDLPALQAMTIVVGLVDNALARRS
jgi:transcriptional regulator with XRE-family HTH domain